METNPHQKLVWRIAVPVIAMVLVIGIIIYTGGYGNFLKLLGIKASELQTIELTSVSQMLGNSPDTDWLVANSLPALYGTSAFDSFTGIPNDPAPAGFIMPIYSSSDSETNTYKAHTYISPAIDLGSAIPILSSYGVTVHLGNGGAISYSYRAADTVNKLASANFVPVELAADVVNPEIMTLKQDLAVPVEQYLQVKAEFSGDTFASRSAIYGWKIQYEPNQIAATSASDSNSPADLNPNATLVPITLDLTSTQNLPSAVNVQVLTGTSAGSQEIVAYTNLPATDIAPLYNLPVPLAPGQYALVLRATGYDTQVIAFELTANVPLTLAIPSFISLAATEPTFDLNGDGVINSLDLSILIEKMGMGKI